MHKPRVVMKNSSAGGSLTPGYLLALRRFCFHRRVIVCLLAGLTQKLFSTALHTKFCEKAANGPRKSPLDFGGNPDHVTLGLELGLG